MKQVVFLDIDGVLNSAKTAMFHGYGCDITKDFYTFDKYSLMLIQAIVNTISADVVLSSTWRLASNWSPGLFSKHLNLPIVDRTDYCGPKRGDEIKRWLDNHLEYENYAIVDDDSDMLEHQIPHFVHTSGKEGFIFKDAERLSEILGVSIWDCSPMNKE